MAKTGKQAKRNERTHHTYTVWPADENESDGTGVEYAALDLGCAAELYASHFFRNRDGWNAKWPMTFSVRDNQTGKLYEIKVELSPVPEFVSGEAKEIRKP
jgi:hypothetical protein